MAGKGYTSRVSMMRYLILTSLLFVLTGCTPYYATDIRVKTEVGINADISLYTSYRWSETITSLNDPSGKWQPPGVDIAQDIRLLINRELTKRDVLYNTESTELAVSFQLAANMQALKLVKDPYSAQDVLINQPDADLMVILTDIKRKNIIWISKAGAEIQQGISTALVRKRLDYTITQMFKQLKRKP